VFVAGTCFAPRSQPVALVLRARLGSGAVEEAPLATIPLAQPVERLDGSARVAVCRPPATRRWRFSAARSSRSGSRRTETGCA
jgi:hypothetical protein